MKPNKQNCITIMIAILWLVVQKGQTDIKRRETSNERKTYSDLPFDTGHHFTHHPMNQEMMKKFNIN